MARALKLTGKNSVRNLQYGPRTRLVSGIYKRNKVNVLRGPIWIHAKTRESMVNKDDNYSNL